MRIRILGCSGGIGADRKTTSLLVDDDVLIDAGTGLSSLLLDEMVRIRHIFLTHSHLDHLAALPLLLDSIFERIQEPLVVHGRPETLDALRLHVFNWVLWPDFAQLPSPEQAVLRYVEMAPGEALELDGRRFEMVAANHSVPAAGYLVSSAAKAFAFSGDTTSNDGFWAALNAHERLDLLIVETAFSDTNRELAELSRHYTPSALAADLRKLRHDPDIYITHLKPGAELPIFDEVRVAVPGRRLNRLYDGEVIQL